ncbi:MAG: UDP-N-acetylmuramate--L-alanine ligase [Clostridia bacterium]|nr:UDP-N-acetylmuramate--L-alanine ligase [Clostridia bacterium]
MKKIDFISKYNCFYFIGIGGISMSALAKHLLSLKKQVFGSDKSKSDEVQELINLGITVYNEHNPKNIKGAQVVVYTSAISENNPELIYAKSKGLKLVKRAELLSNILSHYKNAICVSGSHGKTTCSAMLSRVLDVAKKSPTCFIGGIDKTFSNYTLGKSQIAVCEACEYKRNFLLLNSKYKIVLNIDNDHLESFGSISNLISDFNTFIKGSIAVINNDDLLSKNLTPTKKITFAIENVAEYTAKKLKETRYGYNFIALHNGKKLGKIKLNVKGKHNIYNALAVISVCHNLGILFKDIKNGLKMFRSVKRRNEFLGKFRGIKVYADYAHHPNEIKATLLGFKAYSKKDLVIFQPHTYSRTRLLLNDFVNVLKPINKLVLYKTYPARESYDYSGSESKLCLEVAKSSKYPPTLCMTEKELFALLSKEKNIKRAFILGAGDLYNIIKERLIEKKK